jgi:putative ABC transport system permease protein
VTSGRVITAAAGKVTRHRVQALVIFVVLLASTMALTLGLALLGNSAGPFEREFGILHGADAVVTLNPARASNAQIVATRRLPQVTQSNGPFPVTSITGTFLKGSYPLPPITVAGRASPGGPVDQLALITGRWPERPGEIVVSNDIGVLPISNAGQLQITTAAGKPKLTVVGFAASINDSAEAWVVPSQLAALRPAGVPPATQMLYKFTSGSTPAEVSAGAGAVAKALPSGSVVRVASWLTQKTISDSNSSIIEPFILAFAVIGVAMSLLIVANVVSGAVLASYRRIGVLKGIGFTPAQVVAAYITRVIVPAVPAVIIGVGLANLVARPLLHKSAFEFGVGRQSVPVWADIAAPVGMLVLLCLAALLPALRAGRLTATQAIASGLSPRRPGVPAPIRQLGRLPLPRPVTLGLGAPFARPARAAFTFGAILFGATAVVFAVGLGTSLSKASAGQQQAAPGQVQVYLAHGSSLPGGGSWEHAVVAALRAQPGTLRYVAESQPTIGVPAVTDPVFAQGFIGNVAFSSYAMVAGRPYQHTGEIDVNSQFLYEADVKIGDHVQLVSGGKQLTVKIVGNVFDPQQHSPCVVGSFQTLGGTAAGLDIAQYDVDVKPGVSPGAYAVALNQALGPNFVAAVPPAAEFYSVASSLIGLLTVIMALVAGLGVLNTVLLAARDRVHDVGVFKAVGMTPRQTVVMVICWVVGPAIAAAIIAVPIGLVLHEVTAHAMGGNAGTGIPESFINVYGTGELILLALSGLGIAAVGALLPAGWAARTRTAVALRTE